MQPKLESTQEHTSNNDQQDIFKTFSSFKPKLLASPNLQLNEANSLSYLKEHLKFKNTAEFYLNIMQGILVVLDVYDYIYLDRVNDLETNDKFHKIKSKRFLKKLNKKAFKLATNRLIVKNLIQPKPQFIIPKLKKIKETPFNVSYSSPNSHLLVSISILNPLATGKLSFKAIKTSKATKNQSGIDKPLKHLQ